MRVLHNHSPDSKLLMSEADLKQEAGLRVQRGCFRPIEPEISGVMEIHCLQNFLLFPEACSYASSYSRSAMFAANVRTGFPLLLGTRQGRV